MITIAVTGRRPKKLFDEYREAYADTNYDACEAALVRLLTKLAADNGGIHVQCGGAQGADMLAAEAALSAADAGAQVQLDLKLPYPGQDARWSAWGRFGQAAYRHQLKRAASVSYLLDRQPTDKRMAVSALMGRNQKLLDGADVVVCIARGDEIASGLDGIIAAKGGTADMLSRALERGVQHIIGVSLDGAIRTLAHPDLDPNGAR